MGPGRLQLNGVRHQKLVRISLLFDQGSTELNPLFGVFNRLFKGGHTTAQTECGHHEPGVPEHFVGLLQP